jgi:GATA-binding protein
MCCVTRKIPVTDLRSDHPFDKMSDRESSSPQRRRETFPVRSALPSREPSKEDMELAQSLVGHAQGSRTNLAPQNEQNIRGSTSPAYEVQSRISTSPASEQMRQVTPGPTSTERNQQDQSYAPFSSSQSDSVPSGQLCR